MRVRVHAYTLCVRCVGGTSHLAIPRSTGWERKTNETSRRRGLNRSNEPGR